MELFLTQNLAPIMFAGLIVFLLLGFPVAFSLGACGLFFAFVGIELGVLNASLLQAGPLRIFGIMENDTLLGIPFFSRRGRRLIPARTHAPTVRPRPWRPGAGGGLRRRTAGRHHRRGGGVGDLDGSDLAADHAALRL